LPTYYGSSTPPVPPPTGDIGQVPPGNDANLLPPPREALGNSALVNIYVPANAEVWIDDVKTKQVGETRSFKSPPLEPGKTYLYDIRVHWVENGQDMDSKRTIKVQAGRTAHVDFVTQ
jgi:uncharacterized protein (TIGR03000 family)